MPIKCSAHNNEQKCASSKQIVILLNKIKTFDDKILQKYKTIRTVQTESIAQHLIVGL